LYPSRVRSSNIGQKFQSAEHTLEISAIDPAYITAQNLIEILVLRM